MGFSKTARALVSTAILAGALLAWGSPAWAETFTVETTNDSGPSSLRQAVADANATAEPDTIVFGLTVGDTITLSSTLTITNPLTIQGPGTQSLTVSGNNAVRPFYVAGGTTLNISGLTIVDGRSIVDTINLDNQANYGGAIFNEAGKLTIRDSALTSNSCSGLAAIRGGAIYNHLGNVSLINSSIRGYCAFYGGAIYSSGFAFNKGTVTLTGSVLSGNGADLGGAIYNAPVSMVILTAGSRLEENGARRGGGLYNEANSDTFFGDAARITDSTICNNRANDKGGFGGGIYTIGDLVVARSTFSGNEASERGGGLYVGSAGAEVAVGDSTFYGNVVHQDAGGGIAIGGGGGATITNSTLSANSSADGSGIWVGAAAAAPTIRGSIIAGNAATFGIPGVGGNYADGGFNIVGGTATEAGLQTDANGNSVLADNGGPTQTVALVRGSPAIDRGNSFGATVDQRGTPRPRDYASIVNAEGGDGSDVGAFEYVDPDAAPPTVEANSTPLPNGDGPNNSDVTVAMSATDEADGSGVWRISYSASGAQQVSEQNVAGNSAELVVSADGETVVTYWATDGAGNRSESKTLTINLDKTAPETSIGSGPSTPTRSASASFGFSSPEAGATFECKLDGGAFAPCTSPKGYSALKDGKHTFSVRAVDTAGNTDSTPATRAFTVDTTAPKVSKTTPRAGATGVLTNANVKAVFSEAMNARTLNKTTFTLTRVGTNVKVAATVSYYPASKTAVLNPGRALVRGGAYTARISAGTKDLAGNALAKDKSWSFKIKR